MEPLYQILIPLMLLLSTDIWLEPLLHGVFGIESETALVKLSNSVGPYHKDIEYNGRWLSTPNQFGKQASFAGSSFEFAVTNTTFVMVELDNTQIDPVPETKSSAQRHSTSPSLVLTPAKSALVAEGRVSLLSSINGSSPRLHLSVWKHTLLSRSLDPNAVHTFKVTLPASDRTSTLQFRGLRIRKGGWLTPLQAARHDTADEDGPEEKSNDKDMPQMTGISQRKLIEIMAPEPLFGNLIDPFIPHRHAKNWTVGWSTLLGDDILNSTISTVPISTVACLTARCGDSDTRPQDTFFRTGPPGTRLHSRLWSFGSTSAIPHALVLSLGLSDVESFLSTAQLGKHQVSAFTDDLSRTYSTLIQTIRRTAYSPSNLANIRAFHTQSRLVEQGDSEQVRDESFLYNSAPSILPIFLVLPPISSPLLVPTSRQIKTLLHDATSKVLNDLKWHIGDKHTFLIDTTGWLDDVDFALTNTGALAPSPTSSTPSSDPRNIHTTASDFTLTQSGHIKFAHHLSLHLCPYIGPQGKGKQECPFHKHTEYTGNLYVPEIEKVGETIEQKRVEKIQEIFGVKNFRYNFGLGG